MRTNSVAVGAVGALVTLGILAGCATDVSSETAPHVTVTDEGPAPTVTMTPDATAAPVDDTPSAGAKSDIQGAAAASIEELGLALTDRYDGSEVECRFDLHEDTEKQFCGEVPNSAVSEDLVLLMRDASSDDSGRMKEYSDGCTVVLPDIEALACLVQYHSGSDGPWIELRTVEGWATPGEPGREDGYTMITVRELAGQPSAIEFAEPYELRE
ncbi:hypothetical protein ACNI3K_09415 [Demequina sp. SO4-13]|uniref:hypothetical protein n=1 Tax=Demequina sp. SO4-13 TaxID=3401027 RepID=UPI003AF4E537